MAYCLYDGKVDQGSEFETSLYNSLIEQVNKMKERFFKFQVTCVCFSFESRVWVIESKKDISKQALVLIWMYLKVHGMQNDGNKWKFMVIYHW